MSNREFPLGPSYLQNPILNSLYYKDESEGLIAPGSPQFLITEDGKYITTEDGRYLTTEG